MIKSGFRVSFALFPVPLVELFDNLLNRGRHVLETPLPATLNRFRACKRNHIIVPVRALGARWGFCALDR